MKLDPILTPEEIAKYMKLNIRTVYKFIKEQKLPAYKVATQYRIKREDFEKWLEGRKQK